MEIARMSIDGIDPEISAPAPDRLVAGAPEFRSWMIESRPPIYAGIWEATPGKWRITYDEWEYFHVLSGVSIVTSDSGETWRLGPGNALVIRPGFRGTWEVVETTRKEFVIYL
jgi:uncharacterized cupin superfamily protein